MRPLLFEKLSDDAKKAGLEISASLVLEGGFPIQNQARGLCLAVSSQLDWNWNWNWNALSAYCNYLRAFWCSVLDQFHPF